jgi:hypothetical protein
LLQPLDHRLEAPESAGQGNDHSALIRSRADIRGAFQITKVAAGKYSIGAWAQGFRETLVRNVDLASGGIHDLGAITLALAGCDAPGVNCDSIGPSTDPIAGSGTVVMRRSCGADLDTGRVYCPGDVNRSRRGAKEIDVMVTDRNSDALTLAVANGATISPPNCADARFSWDPVEVNGLGPGHDMCVRTGRNRRAHLFITEEAWNDTVELKLWYVIRK